MTAARQDIAARGRESAAAVQQEAQAQQVQARREDEPTLVPAVDIFEDAQGITVQAEMPGVSKERLNIQADRSALLIEGDVVIDMPQGMEALYADVHATRYRRSFVLSSELEPERIEASLADGVLTLRIPKRAEFRPRKIRVS
jgi:HSP20 family molecular chaperone IbpA